MCKMCKRDRQLWYDQSQSCWNDTENPCNVPLIYLHFILQEWRGSVGKTQNKANFEFISSSSLLSEYFQVSASLCMGQALTLITQTVYLTSSTLQRFLNALHARKSSLRHFQLPGLFWLSYDLQNNNHFLQEKTKVSIYS